MSANGKSKLRAILKLDLPRATDPQRMVFHLVLADRRWSKTDASGIGWQTSLAPAASPGQIENGIHGQLNDAAQAAGNIPYAASVSLGPKPARHFTLTSA